MKNTFILTIINISLTLFFFFYVTNRKNTFQCIHCNDNKTHIREKSVSKQIEEINVNSITINDKKNSITVWKNKHIVDFCQDGLHFNPANSSLEWHWSLENINTRYHNNIIASTYTSESTSYINYD